MIKTYIVMIPSISSIDARNDCENIENMTFYFKSKAENTAYNTLNEINEFLGYENKIEVEPITDFMDRCNNEEFDIDKYFISYVYGEVETNNK